MSKTARTPYKTKRRKTKGRASSASSKNSVSDAAELWIAPNSDVFSRLLNVDSDGDDLFIKSRRNN